MGFHAYKESKLPKDFESKFADRNKLYDDNYNYPLKIILLIVLTLVLLVSFSIVKYNQNHEIAVRESKVYTDKHLKDVVKAQKSLSKRIKSYLYVNNGKVSENVKNNLNNEYNRLSDQLDKMDQNNDTVSRLHSDLDLDRTGIDTLS